MDNKKLTLLMLIELSMSFDTVDYLKLIEIFKHKYNRNVICSHWIISYLSDRKQKIKHNRFLFLIMAYRKAVAYSR